MKDGIIVGEGRNLVITGTNPTAHGEVVAIRNTALILGTVDLSGCTLSQPLPDLGHLQDLGDLGIQTGDNEFLL